MSVSTVAQASFGVKLSRMRNRSWLLSRTYLLVVGVGQSEASDYQFAVRPAEPHRLFEIVQHRIGVVLLVLRVDPFSVRVDFQPRHSCGESRPFAAVPLERRSGIVAGRLLLLLEKGFRVASFLSDLQVTVSRIDVVVVVDVLEADVAHADFVSGQPASRAS